MARAEFTTFDGYFETCDPGTRALLQRLREFIRQHAPDATEKISWGMPTYCLNGNLVHFFAHKKHIGFYPGESGIKNFTQAFDKLGFAYSKGAVQFPLNKELPWDLIGEIVRFRVRENTPEQ